MSQPDRPRTTVSANATVTLRCRPAEVLMVLRVRSAQATLELGLADVKRRCEETGRRLTRLGAARVRTGEPHPDDHAETDPMARMQTAFMSRRARRAVPGAPAATDPRPAVNVALTASWDITGRSVEEVLLLVDRLRFDAAADAEPPAPPEPPPTWTDPVADMQKMMAALATASEPNPDDTTPQFLFIARPGEDALAKAAADCYRLARQRAERLAVAAGRTLGELTSLSYSHPGADRSDRMMERQRSGALLAAIDITLQDGEEVSFDPRATEVTLTVHATFAVE